MRWPSIYRGQKQPHKIVGIKSQKRISQKKIAVGSVRAFDSVRSTGPVDRQRSKIRPLGSSGRPSRSTQFTREHCRVLGRPGRSTDSTCRVLGRPGRSADVHMHSLCTLYPSVDRNGRPVSVSSEKSELPENQKLGFWFWFWVKYFWTL